MAWTAPRTWVAGAVVTAAHLNQDLRDNLLALRGGEIALASQAAHDLLYAASATQLARLATGQGVLRAAGGAPSWLGHGTALQVLRMNAQATNVEWGDMSIIQSITDYSPIFAASSTTVVQTLSPTVVVAKSLLVVRGQYTEWATGSGTDHAFRSIWHTITSSSAVTSSRSWTGGGVTPRVYYTVVEFR